MLVYSGCCICASMCYEWCINLYMLHIILQEVIVVAAYAHQCAMSGVTIYICYISFCRR